MATVLRAQRIRVSPAGGSRASPENQTFRLAAGSPRRSHSGASTPLSLASSTPDLVEERELHPPVAARPTAATAWGAGSEQIRSIFAKQTGLELGQRGPTTDGK